MAALATLQHLSVIAVCLLVVYLSVTGNTDIPRGKNQSFLPLDFRKTWTRVFWLIIGVGGLVLEIHQIVTVGWASGYGRQIG